MKRTIATIRAAAFALATITGACSQPSPPPEAAPRVSANAPTPDARRRAFEDGRQAARALARSMGIEKPMPPPFTPPPTPVQAQPAMPPEGGPDGDGYVELDWLKMMPAADLEALKHPTTIRHVGSLRMKQFGSFNTIDAVTGHKVKLPGYVVPLESDDEGRMTEFFFVPFFGACIHVPPPPPNQIVFVHLDKPMKTPEIWQPFWLRGELQIEKKNSSLGGSAYTMTGASLIVYDG